MNPDYLWLTGTLQLLALFVIPLPLGAAIAYATWRGGPQNPYPQRHPILCAISGVAGLLLLGFARWLDADVRTPLYFLQLAVVLISGPLFGVSLGFGFSAFVDLWRWHKRTRL